MKNKHINMWIVLGLILAIIFGILLPDMMIKLSFLGTIYLNLLKFMIVPIIFTSIAVTVYKTRSVKNNSLLKTILVFIIMFVTTFFITSLLTWLIKPGKGFVFNNVIWNGEVIKLSFTDALVNLFPTNMITMFQNNALFGIILFAFVFGIAATKVDKGEKVINFIDNLKDSLNKEAWDGNYYLRAFYDNGDKLGSSENTECKIDLISQSFSILSGVASKERTQKAITSVEEF